MDLSGCVESLGGLCGAGYIFLQSGVGVDDAFLYKAIFVAWGNGNSPKVTLFMQALQVIELFVLIKQDIKNISNHIKAGVNI